MKAIYKREVRACFNSVIGWLFLAVVLFFIDLYVTVFNLFQGYSEIYYALQSSLIIFILAVPVLTMRIFAEERKNKTDQLILTAPVSVWKIVIGKFLALETVLAIPCLVTCIYPLVFSRYGTVSYGETYVAILGFFLYGSAAVAIGMFVSSLTESQVIAAVVSMVLIFIGYVMAGLCNMISATGNLVTKILGVYDLTTPFINLTSGSLGVSDIFYYLSLIAVVLFLTTQSIQKRRYSVSVRQLKRGAYSISLIVVTLAVAIGANILVGKIPTEYADFDITSQKRYSLSEDSFQVMDSLQEDITIYVLAPESIMDIFVVETLKRYESYSDHITVEYIDPAENPAFLEQYTENSVADGSLIVVSDRRSKVIDYNSLYEVDYYTYEATGYDAEGQITSALAYVTSDEMPKVYLLEGHEELGLEASYLSALDKLNVEYESLNLMTVDAVPEDAQCLIVNAPAADFSEDDTEKIRTYLEAGGDALFIYGYTETPLERYKSLIADYDITLEDGMVVEGNGDYYYQNMLYLLPDVGSDAVTQKAMDNFIITPYACGIVMEDSLEGSSVENYLLTTSETAFARKNPGENTTIEKMPEDAAGPFALGVKAARGESRIIVYTSALLFNSGADEIVAGNNLDLFVGSVSSFISVKNSVSIPVKSYEAGILAFSTTDFVMFGLIIVLFMPFCLLLAGFVIWLSRRKL